MQFYNRKCPFADETKQNLLHCIENDFFLLLLHLRLKKIK